GEQASRHGGTQGGAGLVGAAALARAVLCGDHVVVGRARGSGRVAKAGAGPAAGCTADGGVGTAADGGALDVVAGGTRDRVPGQADLAIARCGRQAGGRWWCRRLRRRDRLVRIAALATAVHGGYDVEVGRAVGEPSVGV